MKEFRYFVHDGGLYVTPHTVFHDNYQPMMRWAEQEAKKALEEAGADHAIYAVTTIKDGMKEVDFYVPAVTLNDVEFDKRTDAQVASDPSSIVYALHAMR